MLALAFPFPGLPWMVGTKSTSGPSSAYLVREVPLDTYMAFSDNRQSVSKSFTYSLTLHKGNEGPKMAQTITSALEAVPGIVDIVSNIAFILVSNSSLVNCQPQDFGFLASSLQAGVRQGANQPQASNGKYVSTLQFFKFLSIIH